MITTSQYTTLSVGQLHILEMMNRCKTEESLRQLKKLLFDFYSKEAVAEADRLWEAGVINESKIEEWGQEHMRTPYIHAKGDEYIVSNDSHFRILNDIDWPKLQLVTIQEFVKKIDK